MTIITFDTLKFARKLKDAGISEKQAEAEAEAIKDAFAEALNTQVATKNDISKLEAKITLLQWMIGLVIVVVVIPLLKDFF